MMFFFDPRSNKLIYKTDETKLEVVSWAEKGFSMHIRVLETSKINDFYGTLPVIYSKIIYDPFKEYSWVNSEGTSGICCVELERFVKSFQIEDD